MRKTIRSILLNVTFGAPKEVYCSNGKNGGGKDREKGGKKEEREKGKEIERGRAESDTEEREREGNIHSMRQKECNVQTSTP